MKTPEKIKKGLECCQHDPYNGLCHCNNGCPYWLKDNCDQLRKDALALIEQLEREKKDLLEERELNDFLRDKAKEFEAQIPKWISVEERLPEAGVFVLLQYAKNSQNPTLHARNTMAVGRYEYGMFLVEGCCVRVTHWMPLPEPPKEET